MSTRRALLAASALVFAVGCSGTTDFTISKTFQLDTIANQQYEVTQDVNLAQEAGTAWKHRDNIRSLDVVGVDATMTERTDSNGPSNASGTITLSRADGTSAQLGTWTHTIAATAPDSISVTLNPYAVSIVNAAIHSDGLFTVAATATTDRNVQAKVVVDLHMKLGYRFP